MGSSGGVAIYAVPNVTATISNCGTVEACNGWAMSLSSGGTVVNDATGLITSGYGVVFSNRAAGTVTNFGSIIASNAGAAGVFLGDGGSVANGDASHASALIEGYSTGIRSFSPHVTITNGGTIAATGSLGFGVYLLDGGSVTNGSASDTGATIVGMYRGITATVNATTVTNYGHILSTSLAPMSGALKLEAGAKVVNGTASDTSASIIADGPSAIYIKGLQASDVTNFGTVEALATGGTAIYIRNGGTVTNGSATDTHALISATYRGVVLRGPIASSVVNFGTIVGANQVGVNVYATGQIINGSQGDTSALIEGAQGVYLRGRGTSTVANFGSIVGSASGASGVSIYSPGILANGASGDRAATIMGGRAGVVMINGNETITNYGTISGAIGVNLTRYLHRQQIMLTGSGTVINAGTIASTAGAGGVAINFGSGNERLILETGSTLIGRVIGGTGSNVLELASGTGSVYGIGRNISNFGSIAVDAGGSWTLTGANTIASGVTLTDHGALTVTSSLVDAGIVLGTVAIASGGALSVSGTLYGGTTAATFAGAGTLSLYAGAAITGVVAGNAQATVNLMASGYGYVSGFGTKYTGFGLVELTHGGKWTMTGANALSGGLSVTSNGTLVATGATTIAGPVAITGTGIFDARAGLTLAGGSIAATSGTIEIGTAGGAATWTTTVDAGSTLQGFGTVSDPIVDNGTVTAQSGTLALLGRVSGSGYLDIASGAAVNALGRLAQVGISFLAGGNETLVLGTANAQLAPTVSGFANSDVIDLAGIVASTETLVGSTLKLFEGSVKVASINLAGSYAQSNFVLSSDGHGGTFITASGLPTSSLAMIAPLSHH